MSKIKIIIPARKGSKGWPKKNRFLIEHTLNQIKDFDYEVIISTNDEFIVDFIESKKNKIRIHKRSEKNSSDKATTKDFLKEIIEDNDIKENDIVVLLMVTYPGRKSEDIQGAISFFNENNCKSMLCKKKVKTSPYLMMYELPNFKGSQVIRHNFCRRQDYKPVFEISHYISIFYAKEIEKLNNNVYNDETIFFEIDKKVYDIDRKEDFEEFIKNENENYS